MGKSSTTAEFVEKSKTTHGDKYQYDKTSYIRAQVKVCITCPKHGDFYQTPNSHLNGNGCPKCGGESISRHRSNRVIVHCIVCGKEISKNKYWADQSDRHLCSRECWSKWAKESGFFKGENSPTWKGGLVELHCAVCGKAVYRDRYHARRNTLCFCSKKCQGKFYSTISDPSKVYPLKYGKIS